MSHDIYGESMLHTRNFETQNSTPYTTRVLPVHAKSSRRCKCSSQIPSSGEFLALKDSVNESKNGCLFGVDAVIPASSSSYWQLIAGTRNQVSDTADHLTESDNQKQEGEEEEEKEEEEETEEEETTQGDIVVVAATTRIPTMQVDQGPKSNQEGRIPPSGERTKRHPLRRQANVCVSTHGPNLISAEDLSSSTSQEYHRSSSPVNEGRGHRKPVVATGHIASTAERWGKAWSFSFEIVFFSLALLFIAPVSGGFDRGGFQHQITWGRGNSPPGSAVFGNSPTNVTAVVGHRARLPCQVKNLGLKDVSWIRQRDLHILTVGIFTYTSDDRFKVFHPHETEDWYLDISSVTFRDSGIYECQVSTSPKVSLPIFLTVLGVQEADIPGPDEVFIQHGSTISLQCEVQAGVEAVGPVHWLKGADTLNYSSPRGGISMEVEKTPTKTMSKLYITRAVRADSGNYTCAPLFAKPDSVLVHVVNAGEESAAAVHSGSSHCEQEESILIWGAVLFPISWLFLYLSSTRP